MAMLFLFEEYWQMLSRLRLQSAMSQFYFTGQQLGGLGNGECTNKLNFGTLQNCTIMRPGSETVWFPVMRLLSKLNDLAN